MSAFNEAVPPPPGGLLGGVPNPTANLLARAAGLGEARTLRDLMPAFGTRPEVANLYFADQKVTLDGYRFVRCRFDRCSLIFTTSNFELIECVVDQSTTLAYGPEIGKVLQLVLWKTFGDIASMPPWLMPKHNPNGSITIADT